LTRLGPYKVEDIKGIIALPPTPSLGRPITYKDEFTVNLDEARVMVRKLLSDGVDGIATNGTLGEMATLTLQEWRAFAREVADEVRRVNPNAKLFIGATTLNTRDTISRIEFLVEELKVHGVFLGRPMWQEMDADNMINFYKDIADAFPDISIMIYDNPEAFKGLIPTKVYKALAEKVEQVVAVKYTTLIPGKFMADVKAVEDRIRILPIESDWLLAYSLYPNKMLATWSSSVACGPEPVVALKNALMNNDLEAAREITELISWSYETFVARENFKEFSRFNIQLENVRFNAAGYIKAGYPRPPYTYLPEEYRKGAEESGRRWRQLVEIIKQKYPKYLKK